VLAALVVGDQSAIDREDWSLYRATGVAHLMSISGLHVTMFAWVAGLATGGLWRRWPRAMLALPAPQAARWGGLVAALAYAVFAGWGVPAQRTVLMLAVVTLIGGLGLRWPALAVWLAAMAAVVLIDPWALLQAGFWLSFVAVGLLMLSDHGRVRQPPGSGFGSRLRHAMQGGLRTQLVATLGLAPLSLVFFQQISVVGFIANLIAIPVVTLCVTPLAMLGMLLPPLWLPAAWLVAGLNTALQALAEPGWAVWSVAAAPTWAVPAALLGAALALAPLPWRLRALAVPLVLPLLVPVTPRPAHGGFELLAADIGQGTAVLVRTAQHALLYDAGPQYSREADAGERVLLPLLRALGQPRLDVLMLSHRDTDHVGGAAALLNGIGVDLLSSSLEAGHPLLALAAQRGATVEPCVAGRRWQWDGVDFELMHPDAERLARTEAKPNTLSCVLKVSRAASGDAGVGRSPAGAGPASVLLTGDLEREQELALVARHGAGLKAELLLVPHHGSKTSSSAEFLEAVAPRLAVVQAGYRNRFGHPAETVVQRYEARGIALVPSARCGAWTADLRGSRCRRAEARRYWQHPDIVAGHNGVEVANSAAMLDREPDAEPDD
jgi:competence protein ComEC